MKDSGDQVTFLTLVSSADERRRATLLVGSIRSFGGPLRRQPIWLFESDPQNAPCSALEEADVQVLPLQVPDSVKGYPLAAKVAACARAEELAGSCVSSLVWLSSDCLIIQPPLKFHLTQSYDAAFRPVHIRNIGSLSDEPLDGFWTGVYGVLGVRDIEISVESFVDRARVRAYYNTHAFAVNPSRGLLGAWLEHFKMLVSNREFQNGSCGDARHRIFLHQAVLSAVASVSVESERMRLLPEEYVYPYNLHQAVPPDRRAAALNDLVCIAYEDRALDPAAVHDINIHEPLRSWLGIRFGQV